MHETIVFEKNLAAGRRQALPPRRGEWAHWCGSDLMVAEKKGARVDAPPSLGQIN